MVLLPAMSLKFLLLQARKPTDTAREDEHRSFARKLGVGFEQIDCHDLLNGPPDISLVAESDALLMGGAGDYYVSKRNLPGFEALLDLLSEVVDIGHPTFASCFGFQCLVEALGGVIVHDPGRTEVGTFEIELTVAGRLDPIMSTLPESFMAQLGRKDRASRLPDGIPNLARSELSPFQAFRVPDKPIWAFQFHPELDVEANRLRFERYLKGYSQMMSEGERRATWDRFRESPQTEVLLPAFLDLVFG